MNKWMQMKATINYHLIAAEGASLVTQTVWNLLAMWETQVQSLSREESCRREWLPTTVFLPGEIHGQRSLVGYRPWGHKESDTIEQLHCHFSLSCTGEGNGNPLQYYCLENPRDRGAWGVAIYGVAQSRTRLKRLSSSSSTNSVLVLSVVQWGLIW